MIRYTVLVLLLLVQILNAQLKEFTITEMPAPTQFPPIARSYPQDGILIVYSSIQGLFFDSNTMGIDDIRTEENKYYLYLKPETQIITVKKRDYIEGKFPVMYLQAKEVRYYRVESKNTESEIPVNIISQPSGARMYIDGTFVGTTSQHKVKPGVHRLVLEKEGYRRLEQAIEVSENSTLFTLKMEMIELQQVTLTSIPEGATIFINNEVKGITNKALFLFSGRYQLRLSRSGCEDYVTELLVEEGKTNSNRYVLSLTTGRVILQINTQGYEVYVNKEKYGRTDSLELSPGNYVVEIEKEGYRKQTEYVTVVRGERLERKVEMTAIVGRVQLTVTPADAEVQLHRGDEFVRRWIGARDDRGVVVGEYMISVRSEGYKTHRQKLTVKEGQEAKVDITLQRGSGEVTKDGQEDDNSYWDINRGMEEGKKLRPEWFINRDEFETELEYKSRVWSRDSLVKVLITNHNNKVEKQQESANKDKDIVPDLYVVGLGTYDLNREVFPIVLSKIKVDLYVPRNEARKFKEQFNDYSVIGYKAVDSTILSIAFTNSKINREYRWESLKPCVTVFVKGGWFEMGNNDGHRSEKPVHRVWIDDFSIGKYEVTQKEWRYIWGNNPSQFKGDDLPVENVSWNDVQEFLRKLSELTGKKYRLPTEAEWEYAARGGDQSHGYTYSGSNSISETAWYSVNSNSRTHAVGGKITNELGIYDMSGNVWEWCSDWYDGSYYNYCPDRNPKGPEKGQKRILRGGSWDFISDFCRLSYRNGISEEGKGSNVGFRVVED